MQSMEILIVIFVIQYRWSKLRQCANRISTDAGRMSQPR
jgi:hypothetical protein